MANFAVASGNQISNLIVADSLETAEALTGLSCVEYTSENQIAIGARLIDGVWVNPTPIDDEITE
jgi:hypothetical protein